MSLLDQSANVHETSSPQRKLHSDRAIGLEKSQGVTPNWTQGSSESVIETEPEKDQGSVDPKDGSQSSSDTEKRNAESGSLDDFEGIEQKTHFSSISGDPVVTGVDKGNPDAEGGDTSKARHDGRSNDEIYMDPTPKTPRQETSPSRGPSTVPEIKGDDGSRSEIQNIMDQFEDEGDNTAEETDPTGAQSGESHLKMPLQHPPRRSSLEPLKPTGLRPASESTDQDVVPIYQLGPTLAEEEALAPDAEPKVTPKRTSSLPHSAHLYTGDANSPSSPHSSRSILKLPPPEPDPEPDLPFDFHRFLEQLRDRTADPVAKYLRSFLIEFGKRQWMVHEQVKIINDFLTFITNKMAQCEVWRGVSDAEFDNAKEGMEKLVMNRLYSQTFSPAIPAPVPVYGAKGKKRNSEKGLGPGRKGQHQEDIERDEILGQKVRIYGWVQEEHLDIPPVGDSGRRFLGLAQQELLKIKTYRAPRDKVICVLNCCKVIFGLLRNSKAADTSADSFVPLLIYVVLQANPDHLVSNVQYILRFRNQEKLGGEAGYYLSSLMGAIQFIENLDRTSLTISDKDFEKKVEEAVSVIAERHREEMPSQPPPRPTNHPQVSEKSTLSQPEVIPRNSIEAEYSTPRRPTSSRDNNASLVGGEGSDDSNAVSGLLRTIQRPLSSLGRIFSEDTPNLAQRAQPGSVYLPNLPTRLSPAVFQPPRNSDEVRRSSEEARLANPANQSQERKLSAEDAAARQASAEAAQAQRIQRAEHRDVVETLAGMFPDLDKDVIDDVVRVKQGRVGLAVDACLALNS